MQHNQWYYFQGALAGPDAQATASGQQLDRDRQVSGLHSDRFQTRIIAFILKVPVVYERSHFL